MRERVTGYWTLAWVGLISNIIALPVIGLIITRSGKILVTSIVTLIALVILYKTQYEEDEKDKTGTG